MKIDVVIGNPPYQKDTGAGAAGGTALYPDFIEMAKTINSDYISMITPSRYFTGGMGINEVWKDRWLGDNGINTIVHYPLAEEVFNGTSIAGGVSYFLWDSKESGFTDNNIIKFVNKSNNECINRQLNEFDNFITDSTAAEIIRKVMNYVYSHYNNNMAPLVNRADNYYGLGYGYEQDEGDIVVRQFTGDRKCWKHQLKNLPQGYRCYVAAKLFDRTEMPENNKVLSAVKILSENEVCNGSYLLFQGMDTIQEAESLRSYLNTKVIRLILLKNAKGNNLSKEIFSMIPIVDFNTIYDDNIVYKMFNINENEIEYINKIIRTLN